MVDRQLRMLLCIVVGLIVIVFGLAVIVGIFTCGVVATVSTIQAVRHIFGYTVPAHTGLLLTAEEAPYDLCLFAIPAEVAIVGIEVGTGTIQEAIGIDLAETRIGTPVVRQHHVCRCHLAERIVHTAVETQRIVAHSVIITRLHIEACTKRSRTVGGRTHTALHVNARHRGCHIRHIHPEDGLALLVVERHIVHGHIDTRMVSTAYTEIGVAHTQSVIARYLQRRYRGEQVGQILSRVLPVERLFRQDAVVDGGLLYSLCHDLHFVQVLVSHNHQRVGSVALHAAPKECCVSAAYSQKVICFHFPLQNYLCRFHGFNLSRSTPNESERKFYVSEL